jgi:hypothetical protein
MSRAFQASKVDKMLSERDRQILSQIEADLGRPAEWRQRLAGAVRRLALPAAAVALVVVTALTATQRIAGGPGAPVVGVLGTVTGWLLLSSCRSHAVGPQLRARWRRHRRYRRHRRL